MIVNLLLILCWFYIGWGIYGLYRLPSIYSRFFAAGFIDTIALITLILALIFYQGLSDFTFRFLLILVFSMITNPISTHLIARSAYLGKVPLKEDRS